MLQLAPQNSPLQRQESNTLHQILLQIAYNMIFQCTDIIHWLLPNQLLGVSLECEYEGQ